MLYAPALDVLEMLYTSSFPAVYNGSLWLARKGASWVNSSQKECNESAKEEAVSDIAIERPETTWVKLLVRLEECWRVLRTAGDQCQCLSFSHSKDQGEINKGKYING